MDQPASVFLANSSVDHNFATNGAGAVYSYNTFFNRGVSCAGQLAPKENVFTAPLEMLHSVWPGMSAVSQQVRMAARTKQTNRLTR